MNDSPKLGSLLPEQVVDRFLHGIGPNLITLGAQVEEVRHDLFRDRAVRFQELIADVETFYRLAAVVELGNDLVDLLDLLPARGRLLVTREDAQQQDLGLRRALVNLLDDGRDAL